MLARSTQKIKERLKGMWRIKMGNIFSKALFITCFAVTSGFSLGNQSTRGNFLTSSDDRDCYEPGHRAEKHHMYSTYNLPARIDTDSWDLFVSGSFIYWQALEEGLDVGLTNPSGSVFLPNIGGSTVEMDFDFNPGFKIGLGYAYSYDGWENYIEYTYLRANDSVSKNAPQGGSIYTNWMEINNDGFANSVYAKWKLNLDLLDFELARSYYTGTKLTFRPHIGLRSAWIKQKLNVFYTGTFGVANRTVDSRNQSTSWSIGPRIGVDSHWLFDMGFRGDASVATSIVYTHYKIDHIEPDISNANVNNFFVINDQIVRTFRPNAELCLGFAWGTYFWQNRFHFDFVAKYEFHVFWSQNVMRQVLDSTGFTGTGLSDLYLQGLTLTTRFDF